MSPLKLLATAAALAGLLPRVAEAAETPIGGEAPRFVCSQPSFDWGTIFTGEEVVHRYEISNAGTAELKIEQVRESCGCTKKDFTPAIPPGGAGHVTLAIDTRGMTGTVRKTATVMTNDPKAPSIVLSFGGNVRQVARLSPSFPMLRGLLGGEPARTRVTIEQASEFPITELKITSQSKRFRTKLEKGAAPGTHEIAIETLPGVTEANFQEDVVLEAAVRDKKIAISFKVHAILKHRVELTPAWLIIQSGEIEAWEKDPAKVPARALKLRAHEGVTFAVARVETKGDFLAVDVAEKVANKEYDLTVKLTRRPEGPARPARGRIMVHTSDPIDTLLEVSVSAFFPEPPKPPQQP